MRWFALLMLLGCAESGPSEPPAPAPRPVAPVPPDPAPATGAAPAPPSAQEPSTTPRERYDRRPAVAPLKGWPSRWISLTPEVDGRLLRATAEVRARMGGTPSARALVAKIALFGEDAASDARVLKALQARGLAAASLPEAPVDEPSGRWQVEVARFKGEAPRESHYEVTWGQDLEEPANRPACKAVPPVELPPEAPGWLDAVTNARSTRRRVVSVTEVAPDRRAVTLSMLYQNGYAQDEAVAHFSDQAVKQGYKQVEGTGLKQTWRHPDGHELAWWPTRRELGLGCEATGPVLELAWKSR